MFEDKYTNLSWMDQLVYYSFGPVVACVVEPPRWSSEQQFSVLPVKNNYIIRIMKIRQTSRSQTEYKQSNHINIGFYEDLRWKPLIKEE